MELELTTPALLFSTISLLLLAYTNRFLGLARIIRELYRDHQNNPHQRYVDQINNLRTRVELIRNMQSLGVGSLLVCTVCIMLLFVGWTTAGTVTFALSLLLMAVSLAFSIIEIRMSVGALNVHLADMAQSEELRSEHESIQRNWTRFFRFSVSSMMWMCLTVAMGMLWYRDRMQMARQSTLQTSLYGLGVQNSWSVDQILHAPDTSGFGDLPTAWTSRIPDSGQQWVVVEFPSSALVSKVEIHETYHPGTIVKLASVSMTGNEEVIWEGTDPLAGSNQAGGVSTITLSKPVTTRRLKIVLNTDLVSGWNEIDAVAIVDSQGNKQWASQAWASSSFGVNRSLPAWFWP